MKIFWCSLLLTKLDLQLSHRNTHYDLHKTTKLQNSTFSFVPHICVWYRVVYPPGRSVCMCASTGAASASNAAVQYLYYPNRTLSGNTGMIAIPFVYICICAGIRTTLSLSLFLFIRRLGRIKALLGSPARGYSYSACLVSTRECSYNIFS